MRVAQARCCHRCSGIIDSHALMLSYQADAEATGATIAFRMPALEAAIAGGKIGLQRPAGVNWRKLRPMS